MSKFPILSNTRIDGSLDITSIAKRASITDYFLSISSETVSYRSTDDVVSDLDLIKSTNKAKAFNPVSDIEALKASIDATGGDTEYIDVYTDLYLTKEHWGLSTYNTDHFNVANGIVRLNNITPGYYNAYTVFDALSEIGETRFWNGFDLQDQDSLGTLSWSDATRTMSIGVKSGQSSYHFWVNGKKVIRTTTVSITIPNTTDTYYIYFDNSGTIQYTNIAGISNPVFYEYAIVGLVYWNAATGVGMTGDERHGIRMSSTSHQYNHETFGARYASGMDITGLTDGGTTYSNIESGVFWDEDIRHDVQLLATAPFIYRNGSNGDWVGITPDNKVGHIESGNTYISWNEYSSGTWKLTEATSGSIWGSSGTGYMIHFVIVTPDINGYNYKKIIAQHAYGSRSEARAAVNTEVSSIRTDGLPSPEFVFLFAIIVDKDGKVVPDSDGNLYYDLRKSKGGASSSSSAANYAADVVVDTSNFDHILNSDDDTVQEALDKIDDAQWTVKDIAATTRSIYGNSTLELLSGNDIDVAIGTGNVINFNHKSVSRGDTTSAASLAYGDSFGIVSSVASSARGHITGLNIKTITLPSTRASGFNPNEDVEAMRDDILSRDGDVSNIGVYNELYIPNDHWGISTFNNRYFQSEHGVVSLKYFPGYGITNLEINNWNTAFGWGNWDGGLQSGYVPYFNGTALIDSVVYTDGTNVGIGTTSSSEKLAIEGNLAVGATSSSGYRLFVLGNTYLAGTTNFIDGETIFRNSSASEVMRLVSSKNVGIGTNNPQQKLEIQREADYQLRLTNTDSGGGFWNIGQADNAFSSGGNKLVFVPDTTTASHATVVFENTGNVGIGTTAPTVNLDVVGESNTSIKIEDTSGGASRFFLTTTTQEWRIGTHAGLNNNFWIYDGTVGDYRLVIDTGGNVGIGTTNPSELLHIKNATANILIESITSGQNAALRLKSTEQQWDIGTNVVGGTNLVFYDRTNAQARVSITNTGNVGIGITNPTAVLHIKRTDDSTYWLQKIEATGTTQNALNIITSTTAGTGIRFDVGGQSGSFTLLNSGFVGIGYTTDPTSNNKLAVNGNSYFNGKLYIAGEYGLHFSTGTNQRIYFNNLRAIEGLADGSELQVAENFSATNLRSSVKIGTVGDGLNSDDYVLVWRDANTALMKRSIQNIIADAGYWSRDAANGYTYLTNSTDKVGIGISIPTKDLDVVGITGIKTTYSGINSYIALVPTDTAKAAYINLGSSGSQIKAVGDSDISLWTNGASRLHITDNGHVGINMTSPNFELEVNGIIGITGTSVLQVDKIFSRTGSANLTLQSRASYGVNVISSDGNSSLYISDDKKVGIGTLTPSRKLTILDSAANVYIKLVSGATDSYAGIEIANDARTWTTGIRSDDSFVISQGAQFSGGYPFVVEPSSYASSLSLKSGGNVLIAHSGSGGNVGIGIDSPSYKTQIDTTTDNDGLVISKSGVKFARITQNGGTGAGRLDLYTGGFTQTHALVSNSTSFINNVYNFGLGTTSPSAKLGIEFSDTSTNLAGGGRGIIIANSDSTSDNIAAIDFAQSAAGSGFSRIGVIYKDRSSSAEEQDMFFRTIGSGSSSEVMRITGTGNVLIGTSTDSGYKLDVNGDVALPVASKIYFGGTYNYLSYSLWEASASYGMGIKNSSVANSGHIYFSTSAGEVARISREGALLIGYTSDPTSGNKLAVNGTGYFNGTVVGSDATASNQFVTLGQITTGTSGIWTRSGTTVSFSNAGDTLRLQAANDNRGIAYHDGTNFIISAENGGLNLTPGSGGNVSIGISPNTTDMLRIYSTNDQTVNYSTGINITNLINLTDNTTGSNYAFGITSVAHKNNNYNFDYLYSTSSVPYISGSGTVHGTASYQGMPVSFRDSGGNTGNVDNAYVLLATTPDWPFGAEQTITNSYGVFVNDMGGTESKTVNAFGIRIREQNGTSSAYSLYVDGGVSYFGGNVGIGITSAAGSLDIYSNIGIKSHIAIFTDNGADDPQVQMYQGKATRPGYSFIDDIGTGMYKPTTQTIGFSTGTHERARISSTGYVGIHNTNPQQLLHIGDGTTASNIVLQSNGAGSYILFDSVDTDMKFGHMNTVSKLQIWNATDATKIVTFDSTGFIGVNSLTAPYTLTFGDDTSIISTNSADGSDSKQIIIAGAGDGSDTRGGYIYLRGNEFSATPGGIIFGAGNVSGGILRFDSAGTEQGRLEHSGNFLLGTTTDNGNDKLQIAGAVRITVNEPFYGSQDSNGGFVVSSYSTVLRQNYLQLYSAAKLTGSIDGDIQFSYNGDNSLLVKGNKHVIINGTSDNGVDALQVNGTTSGNDATVSNQYVTLGQITTGTSGLWTRDAGNGYTILTNSGDNVGIGTSSPTQALEIGAGKNIMVADEQAFMTGVNTTYMYRTGGNRLSFVAGGTERLVITETAGKIGVGITNPSSKLEIKVLDTSINGGIKLQASNDTNEVLSICENGVAGTGYIRMTKNNIDSNAIVFNAGGNSWFDTGENLGIGTKNPAQKLDVAGNINFSTNGDNTLISNYKGADSSGANIFIGGGGQSSIGDSSYAYYGSYNISLGVHALYYNTTGYQNVSVGTDAMYENTTGKTNTAIGHYALRVNKEGSSCTALGYQTLSTNTVNNNTGVGYQCLLYTTTGVSNTAIGHRALQYNTIGYTNEAFGIESGRYIADGSTANETSNHSLYLGAYTKALADGDSNEIVVGYDAIGHGSNTATWGNTSITDHYFTGNLNATSVAPLNLNSHKVPYYNGVSLIDSSIYTDGTNVGIGTASLVGLLNVGGDIIAGGDSYGIGGSYSNNHLNFFIGATSGQAGAIRFFTGVDGTSLSNGIERARVTADGNVLIGTTTDNGYKLDVNGDINIGHNLIVNNTTTVKNTIYLSSEGIISWGASPDGVILSGNSGYALHLGAGGGSNDILIDTDHTVSFSTVNDAAGDFLTLASGVLSKRTAAEVRTDLGIDTTANYDDKYLKLDGTNHMSATTLITNLNADLWDNNQFSDYINQPVRNTDGVTFDSVNIQSTDTSITRLAAGEINIEGKKAYHAGNSNLSSVDWTANNLIAFGGITAKSVINTYGIINDYRGTAGFKLYGSGDANYIVEATDNSTSYFTIKTKVLIGYTAPVDSTTQLAVSGAGYFNGTLTATQLISTIADGTAPLQVTSTTWIEHLNADLLDGYHASHFQVAGTYDYYNKWILTGVDNAASTTSYDITASETVNILGQSGITVTMNNDDPHTRYQVLVSGVKATTSALGVIQVGNNLTIDANGVLSAVDQVSTNTLGGLGDVDITNVAGGEIIKWSSANARWENVTEYSYSLPIATSSVLGGIMVGNGLSIDANGVLSATPGASSLNDLSDVTITSPSTNQLLKYDGSGWINSSESYDNYVNWNIAIDGVTQDAVTSGGIVDFWGDSHVTISYSHDAGNNTSHIHIAADDTHLTNAEVLATVLTGYQKKDDYHNLDSTNNILTAFEQLERNMDAYVLISTYTASDILTKLLTVDTDTSGLNANYLQGYDAAGIISDARSGLDNYHGWLFKTDDIGSGSAIEVTTSQGSGPYTLLISGGSMITTSYDSTNKEITITSDADKYNNWFVEDSHSNEGSIGTLGRVKIVGSGLIDTNYSSGTLTVSTSANYYSHPTYTSQSASTSGMEVMNGFSSDSYGHVTGISTRTLANATTSADGIMSSTDKTNLDNLIANGVISGAGTLGKIPKWNGPDSLTDSIMREDSSTIRIDGNLTATGEITGGYTSSDRRFKKNIKSITSASELLNKLNPVQFRWNSTIKKLNSAKEDRLQFGLIAQEVQEVAPVFVHPIYDKYLSVDYLSFVPLLIKAEQEHTEELQEKTEEINILKDRLEKLEKQVELLLNR